MESRLPGRASTGIVLALQRCVKQAGSRQMANTTSISLLERLRGPNAEAAWRRFVFLYTPLLYGWARRLGLREQDAGDLVQDVLTVLVRRLPEFRYEPAKSFRWWLRTVALNRWRDRRQRPATLSPEAAAAVPDLRDGTDPAEFVADEDHRRYLVGRALQILRTDFRQATWKAFWEHAIVGRPASEVATEQGMSVDAVYAARSRVMRRLRQELAGLFD